MSEINFSDMREMQLELYEAHKDKWDELEPRQARNQLLWLIEELGEAISIIKKKGETAIMEDEAVRENFCTELADVLMYFNDALICYNISPQEISLAYQKKHAYNMKRDWVKQNNELYSKSIFESKE